MYKSEPREKSRKNVDIQVDDFSGGTNVLFSETRLKPNEAKESVNMILNEDGVWTKRWGTREYLTSGLFTATLDGFTEYKKSDGTRELIVVADGKVWKVTSSGKTEITGATFTQGTRCSFAQINNKLYIVNGTDAMARYDGSNLSTYSSLTTPAWGGTPLTRGAGLSSGNYTYYYRVSAVNAVGETLAVAAESIAVDIQRDSWDEADEYIDLDWDAVASAIKYNIYFSDDGAGYEVYLDSTEATSYRDDGSANKNPYIAPPTADSSEGPVCNEIAIVGNRLWLTGDSSNPQRVYWSGTDVNLGNFSPSYDGGWIDLEGGSRNQTVKVIDFNREAHVVCKTDDGRGSIWEIDFATVEIAGTNVVIASATKLIAQMGTNAARSIVHVENDVYFVNRFGVFTLGYEPNVFNVLRTKEKSTKIRPYIRDAYESDMDKACAYYYDSKVFFSIPTSSGEPNRIFLYDSEKDAWIKDWTIGVSQFGEFTDSSDVTHFLGIRGNKLVEFDANFESDSGTAFTWRYVSPRFPASKDWTKFAYIRKAYIRARGAKGTPSFSFNGTDFDGSTPTIGTDTIEQGISDTGIGWDQIGTAQMGDTTGTPTLFAQESLIRFLTIENWLRDMQWEVEGNGINDTLVLTGIQAEGELVETDEPTSWQL